MRRLRSRGPSASELIRQTRVRRLLSKYGAYSRQLVSRSAASELESTSCLTSCTRSSKLASSASALQMAAITAATRRGAILHEDDDIKLTLTRPSQLVIPRGTVEMDKGLALAASQYVARVLASGETGGVDSQRVKEDFLHLLERDWGFAGPENLSLGRIRITIKKRDNELENMRRRAELERIAQEKSRLEERLQSRKVQAVSSQQVSSSTTTKVVKTRVVKSTKVVSSSSSSARTVQTVRAA